MRRYPLEPFLSLTGWTLSQVQDVVACNGSEWRKRKAEGVTELTADRIACAAGFHPHTIWPEMLDHAIADLPDRRCDECDERFVPAPKARRDVRFCSKLCNKRYHYRKRYAEEIGARERERSQRFYAENAEYVRAQKRRRYWQQREAS